MLPLILQSGKRDLEINPPIMNMTGTLGETRDTTNTSLENLGAIVTSPISLKRRTPARPPRFLPYRDGCLLHTGHPNPGFSSFLRSNLPRWKHTSTPIIVHLLAETPEEVGKMVQRLENIEEIAGIELGLLREPGPKSFELVDAATRSELPVLVQLQVDAPDEQVRAATESEPDALSMGPPRGELPIHDGQFIAGRLYGPSLLPLALRAIMRWSELTHIPIIGGCGISRVEDITAMLNAGASAVQMDTILWTRPENILESLD